MASNLDERRVSPEGPVVNTSRSKTPVFFTGQPEAQAIQAAVERMLSRIGRYEARVSKSQIGFYRDHPFAALWAPGRYLGGDVAPVVLSVYLRRRHQSARWKEVVQPAPGRFTHHLELASPNDVDDFVMDMLGEAWRAAG